MIEEKYKPLAAYLESAIGIVKKMGLKVLAMKDGYVKLQMPIKENVNHVGTMYAGSLFTLGEIMGGAIFVACFDMNKYYPIVKDVQIRYRRPALTDITVELSMSGEQVRQLTAALEEKGKADFPLELQLIDAGGEVVSIVQGVWQARKK
jgi:thioesterase domain-containing protein